MSDLPALPVLLCVCGDRMGPGFPLVGSPGFNLTVCPSCERLYLVDADTEVEEVDVASLSEEEKTRVRHAENCCRAILGRPPRPERP